MASPLAALGPGSLTAYWRFRRAVVTAQLAAWLPAGRQVMVDISGPHASTAEQAAATGHVVLRVMPAAPSPPGRQGSAPPPRRRSGPAPRVTAAASQPARGGTAPGRIVTIAADPGDLSFLRNGCADGIIADDSALSRYLMAEDVAAEIVRVLRPGGRVFACADSLVLGMAVLAQQRRWAHLTDLPRADVVLVPWPDGTITRCFGPGQLRELLTDAGLQVSWVRPRTVLSPSTVDHILHQDPAAIGRLVRAELEAEAEGPATAQEAESFAIHLLVSAVKPAGTGGAEGLMEPAAG